MTKTLLLIDGNSILNRAYYALPPMNDSLGRNVNAVYGFLNIFFKVRNDYNPDYTAIAFDMRGKNFRHQLYDQYKANRKGMPDDLALQMPILQDTLQLMGIKILQRQGIEADDIIGTMSKRFDVQKLIVSGDKDLLQLIDDQTTVLLTKKGVTEVEKLNQETLQSNYNLKPYQIIEFKALRGDTADNIPGVIGVGEKTAQTLIDTYCNIDNLYAHIDEIKGALKEKLVNNKTMAYLSRQLATIDTNVEIECNIGECSVEPFGSQVKEKFIELEFRSLVKKLNFVEGNQTQTQPKMQTNTINVANATELRGVVDKLYGAEELSIYCGNNVTLFDGIEQYSVAISDNFLDGMNYAEVINIISPLLSNNTPKTVYDAKSLKHSLRDYNISLNNVRWDVSIMQYLVEYRSFKNVESLAEYHNIDVNAFGLYCIKNRLVSSLADMGMNKLYYDIELPLMQVLYDMEIEGVKVDIDYLNKQNEIFSRQIVELSEEVYILAGEQFNIQSTKQLAEILFEKLMLPHGKKTKTGYSTNNDVLEMLRDAHPIVPLIMEIRKISKLNSTYIEGIKPLIKNGLIHTTYNQTLTATGRLSSSEPNLQNIPIRNEQGKELRKMFVPKYDMLISADYSQIELRLLANFSHDKVLSDAFNSHQDIHRLVASEIFGIPMEMVTDNMRRTAKAVNFGIIYGISDFGLSENIGISTRKAKEYITKYFEKYPTIKTYLDGLIAQAKTNGYVDTIAGRRRQIPELKSSNYQLRMFGERVAMNMPLQGSAADIMKIAMVNVYNKFIEKGLKSRLIMQVHDELIVDTVASEEEMVTQIMRQEMEHAVNLDVILTVNIEKGGNLYESK